MKHIQTFESFLNEGDYFKDLAKEARAAGFNAK